MADPRWKHDVFISHRSTDTKNFIKHLLVHFHTQGIRTFTHNDQRAENVPEETLVSAVQHSPTSVILFSPNYASSTHCLNELVHIMDCVKRIGQSVIPIFYCVKPSDVRNHRLDKLKYPKPQLSRWTLALSEAAKIPGFHLNYGCECEYELTGSIVRDICSRIHCASSRGFGLMSWLPEFNHLTTTKRARALVGSEFEASKFVDFREGSVKYYLERLQNVNKRISMVKRRLSLEKVLLVLDDADNISCTILCVNALPLALKVLGASCLFGGKIDAWKPPAFSRIPSASDQEMLVVSNGDLSQVDKTIFLGSIAENIPKRCKAVFQNTDEHSTLYGDLKTVSKFEDVNSNPNPMVSRSNICSEKAAQLNTLCSMNQVKPCTEVCVQSKQTHGENCDMRIPESRHNPGLLAEEADGGQISWKHCTDLVDPCLNDSTLEATYASFESEATAVSRLIDTETHAESAKAKLSEETKKALQILRDSVSKSFSFLLDPGQSMLMKIILDYLLSLSEDEGISVRMRSVILQLSRSFTQWSRDYHDASGKIEQTSAELSKVDKLEVDIEANVKKLKEVDLFEDDRCSRLASLQERKRELEEQIRVITQEITEFGLPQALKQDAFLF